MKPEELRDKNIFLALWSEDASDEAIAANKDRHENRMDSLGAANASPPYFLENWNEAPCEILLDQYIISVYVGPKGGVRVDGAYLVHEEFFPTDGIKLHICKALIKLRGRPFGKKQKLELEARIRECTTQLKPDAASVLIPLDKFVARQRDET